MENKVYAQVYSLIKTSPELVLDALKTFSDIGYDGVEGIGVNTGGLSNADFKKYADDLNIKFISFHGLRDEAAFAFGQEMGARFCDMRLDAAASTREQLLAEAESMNAQGKLAAKFGLKACLHNHSEEFRPVSDLDGKTVYEFLLENTDPEYVGFELDVGWATLGGAKVHEIVAKYPGRFPLIHAKECNRVAKTLEEMEHFPTRVLNMGAPKIVNGRPMFSEEQMNLMYEARNWNRELGNGLIDWPALVAAAEAQGTAAYINEREYYHVPGADGDEVKCAELDYKFLRSL